MTELFRETMCEILNSSTSFLHLDLLILLFFGLGWQTLPRQTTFDKVHEHHTYLF